MYAQRARGDGVVAARRAERVDNRLFLGLEHRAWMLSAVTRGAGDTAASITASGRSSGRISSVVPSTAARSIVFSSSRTFPGQS